MSEKNRQIEPGELCLQCGLCCDGSVFTHANLNENERRPFFGGERPIADKISFPCHWHKDKSCTIYERRPGICRSYRCKTLRQVQSGDIPLRTGRQRIATVVNEKLRFDQSLPATIPPAEAIAAIQAEKKPDTISNEIFQQMRLSFVALQRMVDQHIRTEDDPLIQSNWSPTNQT